MANGSALPQENRDRRARGRRALVVVFALAAAIRLVPFAWSGGEVARVSTADSTAYLELSQSLLERGTHVRFPPPGEARIGNPWPTEVFRTPGYPAMLAAVRGVGGTARAILAVQIVMDLLAVLLCAWIGTRLFGPSVGVVAALLLAVDVGHAVYANMLMSDVPFALAVTASVALVVRAVGPLSDNVPATDGARPPEPRSLELLLAGLATTVACAIRPVAALAGVPLAVYARWRGAPWRGVTLLLVGSLTFPAVWIVRNEVENGVATLSNAHTFNLYLLAASKVKARAEGITQAEAFDQVVASAVAELHRRGPGEWDAALRAAGASTFSRYPGATLAELARGVVEMTIGGERRMVFRLFGSPRGGDQEAGINQGRRDIESMVVYLGRAGGFEALVVLLQLLVNVGIAAGALVGLWKLWRAGRSADAFLIGVLVAYFLLGSVSVASARMRVPVSFLLDLAAASAIVAPHARHHQGRRAGEATV